MRVAQLFAWSSRVADAGLRQILEDNEALQERERAGAHASRDELVFQRRVERVRWELEEATDPDKRDAVLGRLDLALEDLAAEQERLQALTALVPLPRVDDK